MTGVYANVRTRPREVESLQVTALPEAVKRRKGLLRECKDVTERAEEKPTTRDTRPQGG
jgi:hypothetical protein